MDIRRRQRLLAVLQQQGGQHIARGADPGHPDSKADDPTDHPNRQYVRQVADLKYSLAPFVASSAAEQARFYDFFDAYVREQAAWADAWLEEAPDKEDPPGQETPSPDYSLPILLTALVFLLLVAALRQCESPPPPPLRIQLPPALQPQADNPYPVLREGSSYRFSALPATADTATYRWAVYDTVSGRELQAGSGRYFELAAAAYGRPQRLVVRAPDKRADSLLLRIHCAQPPAMPDWQVSATPALPGQAYRFAVAPADSSVSVVWVFNRQDSLLGAAVSYTFAAAGRVEVECTLARNAADCYTSARRSYQLGGGQALMPLAAMSRDDTPPTGQQRPRPWLWLLCLLPLLPAAWLLREWHRKRTAPPAPGGPEMAAARKLHKKAPYVIPYLSPDSHISCPPDFFRMAEQLRRREEGERSDIDIEGSIQATIEGGGYPVLREKRDTRPGDYLLLIEQGTARSQQLRLFARLAAFFRSQDAPVHVYFHNGSFNSFWNDEQPQGVSWGFLQKKYDGHRLVLIGSGHGLLDAQQPRPALQQTQLRQLQHWQQVLCLTPLPVSAWMAAELLLHRHFLLYPADTEGILAGLEALSALETYEPGPFLLWEQALKSRRRDPDPRFRLWETVEDHRDFLAGDDEAFRWLCGLAVCVSPDFALTVAIGRKLGIEVTHDRLLRLSRIPWLDRNEPDTDLRLALLRELSPADERLAREAVKEALEAVRAQVANSFAFHKWETSLAIQQFALSPEDPGHRQLLRDLLALGLFSGSQRAELDGLVQRRLQPTAGEDFGIVAYLQQPEPRPFFTAPLLLALACLGLSLGLLLAGLQQPPRLPAVLVENMPDEAQRWHNAGVDTARQLLLPADYDRWRARAGADSSAAALFEKALRARGSYPLASYHRRVLDYNMGAQGFNFALGDKIAGSAEPPAGLLPAGQQQGAAVPGLAAELPPEVLRSRRFQALLSAAGRFAAAAAGTAADDRLGWAARHGYGLCQYYLAADYGALPPDSARASYTALEALTEGAYFDSLRTVMPVNLQTLLGVAPPPPPPGSLRLRGRVLDAANDRPLAGALVLAGLAGSTTAEGLKAGRGVTHRLATDAQGRFVLEGVAAGLDSLLLYAEASGYRAETLRVPLMARLPSIRLRANGPGVSSRDPDPDPPIASTGNSSSNADIPTNPPSGGSGGTQPTVAPPSNPQPTDPANGTGLTETDETAIAALAGTFVLVAGGSFDMGCTREQRDCESDEPVHWVTLSSYYIGQYEVTQAQWRAVMGNNPSEFQGCDQCPVERVSWEDVQEFIRRLNQRTGLKYRLPTEAEWEFAARGGNNSERYQYAGGNNLDEVGWYSRNAENKTHPVGQKKRNELGLYDMSGNVWEWCQDWYGDYPSSAQTNPTGPATGAYRVLRGGSWRGDPRYCRVAARSDDFPGNRFNFLGFRLARTP